MQINVNSNSLLPGQFFSRFDAPVAVGTDSGSDRSGVRALRSLSTIGTHTRRCTKSEQNTVGI